MSAMRMALRGSPMQRAEPLRAASAGRSLRRPISTAPIGAPLTSRRTSSTIAKVFKPESDSSQEGQVNGAPDWRSVPKEAMSLFETAQDHMLTLNNSRLKALEELKISKKRIAELQVELDAAREELAAVQAGAAAGGGGGGAGGAVMEQQQQVQQASVSSFDEEEATAEEAASSGGDPPAPAAPTNTITVLYATGWHECFAHFNVDDKGWTDPPGWKMTQEGDSKQLVVEGRNMEFCLNNGGSDWDSPPGNYVVTEPGNYVVSGGALHKQ